MKNTFITLITIILLAVSPVAFAADECPLCYAAGTGNLSEVKRLLDKGADVNTGNQYGTKALMWAAANGEREITKLLLYNGANVNDKNRDGWTALTWAATQGQSNVAKLLLDNGADVNARNKHGSTALMIVKSGEIAKFLLDNGAKVNTTNKNGRTALILAVKLERNGEVVKVLLDNGANVHSKDKYGWTALIWATQNGQSEIAKLLLDNRTNVHSKDKQGWTALIWAAHNGQSEVAKLLLDNGANVDDRDENGWTALILAAQLGHSEIVKLMLDNGAYVDDAGKYGSTALMIVASGRHIEVAKILLDNGAYVNHQDKNGMTALNSAITTGQNEMVKLLLSNGAKANYEDEYGKTALIWAAEKGQNKLVKLLLECGANPDIKSSNGYNTWDIAKDKPTLLAILEQNLNDVVQGREFLSCDKAVANKQNKNPELTDGIEARKFPRQNNRAEYVFENIWQTVVYIKTYTAQGSGVIIKPNLVATNCHVVENIINIEVYKAEERRTNRKVSYSAKIIKQDDDNDFCLLSVEGLRGVPATVRKYDTINIGEDVYGLGAPQGLDLSLSKGLVSQLRKEGNKRLIQTDTAISPGSSGGGLFDSDGNLIGILTEKIVDDGVEGLGFAIPADLAL